MSIPLKAKCDILCDQLNIEHSTPIMNIIARACEDLGVEVEPGMTLVQKADMCLNILGVDPAPPVQGRPVEAPMMQGFFGQPVEAEIVEPVVAPVMAVAQGLPVAPVPAAPEPRRTTNRLKLALRDGRGLALQQHDIDATHGRRAFHICMGAAHSAIEVEFRANGNVSVVSGHHTLGFCLDNWYGRHDVGNRQHFSTWYRTHGSHAALRFVFNNDKTYRCRQPC